MQEQAGAYSSNCGRKFKAFQVVLEGWTVTSRMFQPLSRVMASNCQHPGSGPVRPRMGKMGRQRQPEEDELNRKIRGMFGWHAFAARTAIKPPNMWRGRRA